jgi:DNA-binding transcriptional LysR family regulator
MLDFRLVRHLWYFVTVAEERHFGKAARRLGISQPPLTQQIQTLERVLGMTLLERSRKGVFLTREGSAIFNSVRSLLEHAGRVERAVRDASRGASSTLVVGSIGTGLFEILPRLIRLTRAQFPDVSVSVMELHSNDAVPALMSGEIDLALARLETAGAPLKVRPILSERLVAALPAEHRLASRRRVRLADLANEDFVLFPRLVSPSYFDQIVAVCREAGFSPHVAHEASSVVAQMAFVGCGIAVSLVPPSAMRFGGKEVTFRPVVENVTVLTAAAVWNPERCHPRVEDIIELAATVGRKQQHARQPAIA